MAGTLVDTITKHKFSRAMSDEGGTPEIFMVGTIKMRSNQTTLSGGTTVLGSPIVTALGTATNYRIGDYVTVTEGFPSASVRYRIIDKTAHTSSTSDDATLTLDTNASTGSTDVGVGLPVRVLNLSDSIPNLEGIVMNPDTGYVFDYSYTNHTIEVYVQNSLSNGALETTSVDLTGVTIPYVAWGY